jgi:hypothetical protein
MGRIGRKTAFFFEKKKQNTFTSGVAHGWKNWAEGWDSSKSFLVLFSKKEHFF